jgi:hypothetical protein
MSNTTRDDYADQLEKIGNKIVELASDLRDDKYHTKFGVKNKRITTF